jgi:hypothetical protein
MEKLPDDPDFSWRFMSDCEVDSPFIKMEKSYSTLGTETGGADLLLGSAETGDLQLEGLKGICLAEKGQEEYSFKLGLRGGKGEHNPSLETLESQGMLALGNNLEDFRIELAHGNGIMITGDLMPGGELDGYVIGVVYAEDTATGDITAKGNVAKDTNANTIIFDKEGFLCSKSCEELFYPDHKMLGLPANDGSILRVLENSALHFAILQKVRRIVSNWPGCELSPLGIAHLREKSVRHEFVSAHLDLVNLWKEHSETTEHDEYSLHDWEQLNSLVSRVADLLGNATDSSGLEALGAVQESIVIYSLVGVDLHLADWLKKQKQIPADSAETLGEQPAVEEGGDDDKSMEYIPPAPISGRISNTWGITNLMEGYGGEEAKQGVECKSRQTDTYLF